MAGNVTNSDTEEDDMAKQKFNLTDLLNQRSKEIAEEEIKTNSADQDAEKAAAVPADGVADKEDIYNLIPSRGNFYNVEDVQDLKQSIELLGVLQPLLVTEEEEDGKRRIIAGHRRRLAIMQLVEEGKERFRYVPILIKPSKNAILDQLALIMANRFREKTDWEKMRETLETEELVLELKEKMKIEGRTRDLLAEIVETSPAQVGRYKAINNRLCKELMTEFKANTIPVSVIYEASQLPEEYQKQALEIFKEKEALGLPDVKTLKKNWEASKPIPGQMELGDMQGKEEEPENGNFGSNEHENGENEEITTTAGDNEYIDPQPDTITSICYNCTKYETCHDKKATVTNCNAYENRREAQKTDEDRYNEEQAAIDRETKRKLREMQQEEKMQHLPSDEAKKEHDIRLAHSRYDEITSGKLTFLLIKKDSYKLGEEIELPEYKDGQSTGRKIDVEITYIMEDCTGIDENYCILGFETIAFDA